MSNKNQTQPSSEITPYIAGILAWLIPGAGHFYRGRRARGIVICIAICSTFMIGILLGSVDIITHRKPTGDTMDKARFVAQMFTGVPGITTALIPKPADSNIDPNIGVLGRGVDIGQVYTVIAGLLNMLCILDALVPNIAYTKETEPESPPTG